MIADKLSFQRLGLPYFVGTIFFDLFDSLDMADVSRGKVLPPPIPDCSRPERERSRDPARLPFPAPADVGQCLRDVAKSRKNMRTSLGNHAAACMRFVCTLHVWAETEREREANPKP